MKLIINEWDHVFEFDIQPETIAEAALLVRLAMNANKEVLYIGTCAHRDGTFSAGLTLRKAKRTASQVSRGKW